MNERMKQMAEHCGLYGVADYDNTISEDVSKVRLDKFAELIVLECSKVIVNGGYRNPALGEKHPLTPPEIAKMIKEHFGV